MKKSMKILSFLLSLLLAVTSMPWSMEVQAEQLDGNAVYVSGDYSYELDKAGTGVRIREYEGEDEEIVIPSEFKGEPVTEIGEEAFYNCVALKKVIIPDSVTSIGDYAFSECRALTEINMPESVRNIGSAAFSGTLWLENKRRENSLVSVNNILIELQTCSGDMTIPDGIVGIGGGVFKDCGSLTNITISDSVTNIGDSAFEGCTGLTEIIIPDGVTSIGASAFEECTGLTGIIIPDGVTSIGDRVFSGCSGLTSIIISNNVTSVGDSAFSYCSGLTNITIPNSVTSIGEEAFGYRGSSKIPDFVVYGYSGTMAETYAKENGMIFQIGGESGGTEVLPENISKATVTLEKESYIYDGKAKCPSVTVKFNEKVLTLNKDYSVAYSNNVNPGTAKATITGKGGYTGNVEKTFTIMPEEKNGITCAKKTYNVVYGAKSFKINASSKSKLTYVSSDPKVAAVDKNTGKVTIKGCGIATITVSTGTESVKVTIKVSPKKQTVKSVKAAKGRKLTVKWKRDKTAAGYQVQLSLKNNFKKIEKNKKLAKNAKTEYKFTRLKAGKKYYVRVRSYKKSKNQTLYGAWSKIKTVKIKK